MDTTAKEFQETATGCNFCDQASKSFFEINEPEVPKVEGKKYDCLVGLSGGVDSSLTLHYVIKRGWKPLCFSLNNGWNDPRADANIKSLVEKLGVDWIDYKIDLEKYKELQNAFLKGGIRNAEAPTDHILFAVTYQLAVKHGIKWIVSGGNTATESIMPASWGEDPRDLRWIKAVYKRVTSKTLKGLPTISLLKEQYYRLIKRIKFLRLLDFYDYNRDNAIELLKKEYDYQIYGEKHCENTYTWWFQNWYLPEKWGIDKRKAHLSSLIVSGQMKREDALDILKTKPEYPELGIEQEVLTYLRKEYNDYKNSAWVRKIVVKIYKYIPKWIK